MEGFEDVTIHDDIIDIQLRAYLRKGGIDQNAILQDVLEEIVNIE